MPAYEYHCRSCGADFMLKEKIAEHERARPSCPTCRSVEVERVLSAAYPRTPRKS